MANKQASGDMSVFTIGGSSMLEVIKDVTLEWNYAEVDGTALAVEGRQPQTTRGGGSITTGIRSTIADGTRVTNLECSALSIGGTDFKPYIRRLQITGDNETEDTEGATGATQWNQYKGKKSLMAEAELWIPSVNGTGLSLVAFSTTRATRDLVISFTINGVVCTFAATITRVQHAFDEGDWQVYSVTLKGKASDTDPFPTAPTGSTSLLEKAMNTPGAVYALVVTSHATEGVTYSVNGVISNYSFEIAENTLVNTKYTFLSQGPMTVTAT